MKQWSRYNFVLDSERIGKFIYNSRTNSFIEINNIIFDLIKNTHKSLNKLNEKIISAFENAKIIVEENEDDDYYYNKKFLKYYEAFSYNNLSLTIAPTTRCNFRCPYCYEENAIKSTATKEVDDSIIKFIKANVAKHIRITWYGGEPLLNFKSMKYIMENLSKKTVRKKVYYDIITNGYLLNKIKVEFLKNYAVEYIQITIDGPKETNDKTRILGNGKGSFDMILKNLKYAINEMPNCIFAIRVNMGRENVGEFPKLYTYLMEEFKTNKNFEIRPNYIYDYSGKDSNCIKRSEQAAFTIKLVTQNNIKDLIQFYPHFEIGGCTADIMNSFVIDPQGFLCKCWMDLGKSDKVIGSIMKKNSIPSNYSLLSQYMVKANMFNDKRCKKCFMFPVCNGGCSYKRLNDGDEEQCQIFPKNISSYLELHYIQNFAQKQTL